MPFEVDCGICGTRFLLDGNAQKYLLETRHVPVERLETEAFCTPCRTRRAAIRARKRVPGPTAELRRVRAAELQALVTSEALAKGAAQRRGRRPAAWPYD